MAGGCELCGCQPCDLFQALSFPSLISNTIDRSNDLFNSVIKKSPTVSSELMAASDTGASGVDLFAGLAMILVVGSGAAGCGGGGVGTIV